MFRRALLGLGFCCGLASAGLAANLTISLPNVSGNSLNHVTVVAGTAPAVNLLVNPIASGASGVIVIPAATGECVFELKLTFANGEIALRPETDLCQTDGIIVE